jgi:hypothetical protein
MPTTNNERERAKTACHDLEHMPTWALRQLRDQLRDDVRALEDLRRHTAPRTPVRRRVDEKKRRLSRVRQAYHERSPSRRPDKTIGK